MNFEEPLEDYYKKQAEDWEKIARKMAKILMDLAQGNDAHDQADKIVKKHFPKLYKSYQ